ncbi:MAG TPA: DUF805 domain-containing protein [Mesorhizobium sp.]
MSLQQTLWAFFSFSGRLSRPAFALAGLLLYLIRFYPIYRIYNAEGDEAAMTRWAAILLVMLCVLVLSHIALSVKRLHDFNRTGWYSLLFLIGDFLAFLILCLPQGTAGPNRYGRQTDQPA